MRKSHSQVSGQLGHPGSEFGAGRRGGGGRGGSAKGQRRGQGVFHGSPAAAVVSPAAASTSGKSSLGHRRRRRQRVRELEDTATLSHD